MVSNQRLTWIDNGRGFAMFLVMLGHLLVLGKSHLPGIKIWLTLIYSVHVPLFFFISGYLKAIAKHKRFSQVIWKAGKKLVIPYYLCSLMAFLWFKYVIAYFLPSFSYYHKWDSQFLTATLLGLRDSAYTAHIGTLWFLFSLFFVELLFSGLTYLHSRKKWWELIMLSSLVGIVFFSITLQGIQLPFTVDTVPTGLFFYFIGYFYRQKEEWLGQIIKVKTALYLGLMNIASAFCNWSISGSRVDIFHGYYGNSLLFLLSAITGILAIVFFLKKWGHKRQPIFNFIGTLQIYVNHPSNLFLTLTANNSQEVYGNKIAFSINNWKEW